jgi:hypothetical protein
MDSVSFKPIAMLCLVRRAQPRVSATNHWHMVQELPFRELLAFLLANTDSFGGRLKQNLVPDHSCPRDIIIDDATVLRAVEPWQIRFLHFLAIAHVREFMAEEANGQLNLAKAARSLQDKELEAREAAVRKAAVL